MRNEFAKWEIKTSVFSGRKPQAGNCCSVDQGIYGYLTPRNLAVLAEERGDRAEARRLWRMVLDSCPGDPEAMSRGES